MSSLICAVRKKINIVAALEARHHDHVIAIEASISSIHIGSEHHRQNQNLRNTAAQTFFTKLNIRNSMGKKTVFK